MRSKYYKINRYVSEFGIIFKSQTALPKFYWTLKDSGLSPRIKWKIIKESSMVNSLIVWDTYDVETTWSDKT